MRIQPLMQTSLLASSATPGGNRIVLREGETRKASSKASSYDILCSGRLEECIAVAIFDRHTKSGYMCRSSAFEEGSLLEELIEKVQEDYGDLSRLKVFIFGGGLNSPWTSVFMDVNLDRDLTQHITDSRVHVQALLESHFSASQIQIKWIPEGLSGEMQLDTSTGKCTFGKRSLD